MHSLWTRQIFIHNDTLFRSAFLAYTSLYDMLGSPFSSRTGNVIDPHSNPGQFAGRAILTESRRAGRMARRS